MIFGCETWPGNRESHGAEPLVPVEGIYRAVKQAFTRHRAAS